MRQADGLAETDSRDPITRTCCPTGRYFGLDVARCRQTLHRCKALLAPTQLWAHARSHAGPQRTVKESKDKTLSSGQLLGHHLQLPCLNASLHISPRPRRPHAPLYRHDSVCVRPLLERRRCRRKHRPGGKTTHVAPFRPQGSP